ncbi:MAG: hypothetical protein ACT4OK_22845 [Gemmobacter sp.]
MMTHPSWRKATPGAGAIHTINRGGQAAGWLPRSLLSGLLLERLCSEKLNAAAEAIAAEGWKWIEVAVNIPYGHDFGLRKLVGATLDLTDEERATREALRDEFDRLEAEYAEAEDLPEEIDQRLGGFDNRTMVFDTDDVARAGVFVSIDASGALQIARGYVRPEDEPGAVSDGTEDEGAVGVALSEEAEQGSGQHSVISTQGEVRPSEDDEDEDEAIKPLPERLLIELTAHRTLALRDAVAIKPRIAMTALLHKLVLDCFGIRTAGTALDAVVRTVHLPVQSPDLADSFPAQSIDARHAGWKADVPLDDDDRLWDWLHALNDAARQSLLAHCVSFGVNALFERPNPYGGAGVSQQGLDRRLREADRLARTTGLDMVETGWKPTVDNYLGRVTKARILEAVREGVGEGAAQLIDHLKKGEMAKEAERLLDGSGWLPEPLRRIDPAGEADDTADGGSDDLPAFLTEDDAGQPGDEEEEQAPGDDGDKLEHAIAAE